MWIKLIAFFCRLIPAQVAHAHCDGPCGVYDPASSRIAGEAVLSMTKKIIALEQPKNHDQDAWKNFHNTLARYIAIKEEQAELAKRELLILWTDYFKPAHLKDFPDLHTKFWETAKLASACKQEVSLEHAQELLEKIKEIHGIFWKTKGKEVAWYAGS
ncbi:superoxide dismutase, Ni [Candidatus Uhrbacteria bacterium]|nr:superoxide dismutase, Ni [Candidatus Uhrbacteria bacterium]